MNTEIWDKVKQPPPAALKPIEAGRLKGKTDISPQWRYQIMTETFGPCGIGWQYEIVRTWNEEATEGQVFAFAEINLFIGSKEKRSEAIPGIGGSMLVTKEREGLHASDEGYKMAVTDALSVAMKMLGVGADIYAGLWDGSKYTNTESPPPRQAEKLQPSPTTSLVSSSRQGARMATEPQVRKIYMTAKDKGLGEDAVHKLIKEIYGVDSTKELELAQASDLIETLSKKETAGAWDKLEGVDEAGSPAALQSKPKRDPKSIKTLEELRKACFVDYSLQPAQVLSEQGVKSWQEITDTPENCYLKIVAVYG